MPPPKDKPDFAAMYARKDAQSLQVMEHILKEVLQVDYGATPLQLCDAAEMFICAMFLKKVAPEFFFDNLPFAFEMALQAKAVEAELNLTRAEGVSDEAAAILKGAADLTVEEITRNRERLLDAVRSMAMIPLPGTVPIH